MARAKPELHFRSNGPTGNIYAILGNVRNALAKQRRITDYNSLRDAVFASDSYEGALSEIRKYVDLIDDDDIY